MKTISEQDVINVLRTVQDPELHKDLVSLNMIKDVTINGDEVSFTVVLTTPACPLKKKIEEDCRSAVSRLKGVRKININMSSNAPGLPAQINLPVKHIIAVASGKGGVGKSTVAVNLAVALARQGARVGLLDADIYGPNIPTMMGVDALPNPDDSGKILPALAYGIKLMSIGFLVRPGQPLIWRGPMLHTVIRQFLSDVDWGELDYLVVDLPPGTGDAHLSLIQTISLSGSVLVTLPQQVSLEDAARSLSMFKQLAVPVVGVIENMSYLEMPDGSHLEVFGQGGGSKLAELAEAPLLGQIPMDPAVRKGGDEGQPVAVTDPDSASGKTMNALAKAVAVRMTELTLAKN
ncbi:MAG TPA: Mrp/NBP35 family ATP-binding protein [Anaerolineaceae bacterium]|nr:Mrp/NBP35 family ATP-binding protein [Anaerolineaceae bacterium]HPN52968.1 Mrp/NBP35 family ATP-binding protein [Anaerolineaceae bacterium]